MPIPPGKPIACDACLTRGWPYRLQLQYAAKHERQMLMEKVDELRAKLSDKNLQFLPEYEARVRVLQAV